MVQQTLKTPFTKICLIIRFKLIIQYYIFSKISYISKYLKYRGKNVKRVNNTKGIYYKVENESLLLRFFVFVIKISTIIKYKVCCFILKATTTKQKNKYLYHV